MSIVPRLPELPEIEALRRALAPVLTGATLHVLRMGPHDMRARGSGRAESLQSRTARGSWMPRHALLHGATISALHRLGKQLAIQATDGRVLVVQLGMSGQVLVETPSTPRPKDHRHVEWRLHPRRGARRGAGATPCTLIFRDPRRFGGLHAAASLEALRSGAWAQLGTDALDITGAALHAALRGRRAVKAVLLDQSALAGVGNIYADEALFRAGIAPTRAASRVSAAEAACLALHLRQVLGASVARGGSTIRDYRSADGSPGTAQHTLAAYGRGGLPCVRCATTLRQAQVAGRTTVWCPACQPRVHSAAGRGNSRAAGERPSKPSDRRAVRQGPKKTEK